MLLYVLAREDMARKDVAEVAQWETLFDADYQGTGYANLPRQPVGRAGDWVYMQEIKDGTPLEAFFGIIQTVEGADETPSTQIGLREPAEIFNRTLFTADFTLQGVGVEDQIKQIILNEYVNIADPFLRMPYLEPIVHTHTPVNRAITDETVSFLGYLGTALQLDGVRLRWEVKPNKIIVHIEHVSSTPILVDATTTDVTSYNDIYETDVLATHRVRSRDGANKTFYLRSDQTITENVNDPLRVQGRLGVSIVDTQDKMQQSAIDAFAKNKFAHRIEMRAKLNSRIIDVGGLRAGVLAKVKTRAGGVQNSRVTGVGRTWDTSTAWLRMGDLAATLTEKLRGK